MRLYASISACSSEVSVPSRALRIARNRPFRKGLLKGKLKAEGRQGWDPKKFVRPPAYHQIRPSLHLREKLGLSEGVYRPALGTALRRMLINQQKMDSLVLDRLFEHSAARMLQETYFREDIILAWIRTRRSRAG
ncbi:MAG: hypothetical protein WBX00_09945 [Isosphaeraceae bacterium]